jgi:hypothetical protein
MKRSSMLRPRPHRSDVRQAHVTYRKPTADGAPVRIHGMLFRTTAAMGMRGLAGAAWRQQEHRQPRGPAVIIATLPLLATPMSVERILDARLHDRIISADAAAALIQPGEVVAMSGFTGSGYPKAVPMALAQRIEAAHAKGQPSRST